MRVHYRVLYLSMKSPVERKDITQAWWDAFKFTRAVKSARINGYCHIPNGYGRLRIEQDNVAAARMAFGHWLMGTANGEAPEGYAIVPVPSKDAIMDVCGPFRHSGMMAEALAGQVHRPTVHDILRYSEPMQKASEGGPRSESAIFEKMRVLGEIPAQRIILVDDVVTQGGHINAARRRLEAGGATVVCGIVCGRTVWDMSQNPWDASVDEFYDAAHGFEEFF